MKGYLKGLVAIGLMVGIGYIGFRAFSQETDQFYSLTYGTIDHTIEATGYIIRNEAVLATESEGLVRYLVAEGQKVRKNESVAHIVKDASYAAEENPVDFEEAARGLQVDLEKINYEINYLHTKIINDLSRGSYQAVYQLKEALNLALNKRQRYNEILQTQSGPQVHETSNEEITELKSPGSGVITYYFDGYEDVFRITDLFRIDFEKLLAQEIDVTNRSTQFARVGDLIYKVVDSNAFSLLAVVPREAMDYMKIGATANLEFEYESIPGRIVDIYYQEGYLGVLFDTDQIISDFQKIRQVKVKLQLSNFKGLKIENSSLVKRDGQYGVYVMSLKDKPVWVRVRILGYDEEYAIVARDSFVTDEGDGGVKVSTVSLHDEVLRHGSKYSE
ncbi:MAG: hypothetical protein AVO33_02730 [delta proteobacterium ML8_F1]|nr:MAG: hypothetical protein AVO33_02730 [delta proteobacterium ML8_F1]